MSDALLLDVIDVLPAEPRLNAAERQKIIWSSVIGSTVEWYDFLLYGAASALVFNKLFFPSIDPMLGTIASFGAYGVGFLARPLGGAIFGHFGDRIGRKAMLALTLVVMGVATFLVGCLPTYHQIGVLAPVLLVLLRFAQGIGVGGEWGGAVLMVIESAPDARRGFFGSLVQLGYPLGVVMATGALALASLLPEDAFLSWGWRIPFLVSFPLVGLGLFIRLRLPESPEFERVRRKASVSPLPIKEILSRHFGVFLTAVGLKLAEIAYVSIVTIFAIAYVTTSLGLPKSVILNGLVLAAIIELPALPLFGWLSDIYGRKTLFIAACAFCILFAFPLFAGLNTRNPQVIVATVAIALSFGQGIMFCTGAAWMSELFDARLRYSGASLGFQVGAALSGGLTPLLAASLLHWSGGATWPISIYLIALACITLAATLIAPETARKKLS